MTANHVLSLDIFDIQEANSCAKGHRFCNRGYNKHRCYSGTYTRCFATWNSCKPIAPTYRESRAWKGFKEGEKGTRVGELCTGIFGR